MTGADGTGADGTDADGTDADRTSADGTAAGQVEPLASGLLDVGDGQQVYWETVGDPDGKPALFVHGGPGGGCSANQRRLFATGGWFGVLFDQRGCGRSLPNAALPGTSVAANTTAHLIADMERLREHLGVERWLVFGGSWGSTLTWAYAQAHPDRVSEMVHVAVTTTSAAEIDWLYGGVGRFFPDAWQTFREFVGLPHTATGTELARAYRPLLEDERTRDAAARAWCAWEDAVTEPDAGRRPGALFDDPVHATAFTRLCAHYFSRHGFLEDGEVLRHAPRIAHIPTVLIHGQLDLGSPLVTAWRMAQALPQADLVVVPGAGHSSGAGMADAVSAALARFARR